MNNTLRDNKVDLLTTKDYDMHGRRVRNASASQSSTDYTIRKELDDAVIKLVPYSDFLKTLLDTFKSYLGNIIINAASITIGKAASTIAFFGGTPAVQQVLNAYTSDGEGTAYTGIATGVGGTPYAAVADLNQLRVAYETLRASYDDLRTKLQNTTLVG